MFNTTPLAELGRRLALQKIDHVVNTHPEPDLVKAILYAHHLPPNKHNLNSLGQSLAVSRERLDPIVLFLYKERLLDIGNSETISFMAGIEEYLNSELPFGAYNRNTLYYQSLRELDCEKPLSKLIDSFSDIMDFEYTIQFSFPIEKIRALEKRTNDGISKIKKREKRDYLQLGVPSSFRGLPTFVVPNPERAEFFWSCTSKGMLSDPQDLCKIKYGSFKLAEGLPRIDEPYKTDGGLVKHLPVTLVIEEDGFVRLINSRYTTAEQVVPFSHQQTLHDMLPKLKSRLEKLLGSGFGQYEGPDSDPLVVLGKAITDQ